MVDISPFGGNYSGVVVQKNAIVGGFATDSQSSGNDQNGTNSNDVIIKYVHCWFFFDVAQTS